MALKIIKAGMDTQQVLARFEAERQALAMMDHPNIAKVFDAGVSESGRSYFVMELVHGEPITDYCDRHKLTLEERLELFIDVCQAVQHAHQKGIIHRDIKPKNVLVTVVDDRPVPKVIDFGVAKAIAQPLTRADDLHRAGAIDRHAGVHEPGAGGDVEPGHRHPQRHLFAWRIAVRVVDGPFAVRSRTLRQAGFDEIRRIIREVEPPKPSTKISTVGDDSRNLPPNAAPIRIVCNGGCDKRLDWIVMKTLEKDRTRRYATALALVEDSSISSRTSRSRLARRAIGIA